uniref:Uncharacterized protein n=1 Tax=mine drainage metagenome TaxID=410659 RepID=E6QMN7_9ZZZZ
MQPEPKPVLPVLRPAPAGRQLVLAEQRIGPAEFAGRDRAIAASVDRFLAVADLRVLVAVLAIQCVDFLWQHDACQSLSWRWTGQACSDSPVVRSSNNMLEAALLVYLVDSSFCPFSQLRK